MTAQKIADRFLGMSIYDIINIAICAAFFIALAIIVWKGEK